jgi:hypothetical protein
VQEPAEVKEKREAGEVQPQGKETQKVVSKLIWEKTFDEPIEEVIWGEMEVTVEEARALGVKGLEQKKVAGKVKVKYPKVVVPKDEVIVGPNILYPKEGVTNTVVTFLNEKGNITNRIFLKKFDRCYLSSNGEYAGVVTAGFFLMDKNGNVVWRKEAMEHTINHCIISDNGNRILMIDDISPLGESPPKSGFYLYDMAGRQIWKREINEDIFDVKMSKNGKYIAGKISIYIGKGNPPFEDWLFFYNIDERKSWKYKLEEGPGVWIVLLENGDVEIRGINKTMYFTKEGKLR